MSPLLAKSSPRRSLVDHTRDVATAFTHLFGTPGRPTRLGRRWASFFGLDDLDAFLRHGVAAVWLHDWGKANDRFLLDLIGQAKQLVRHEHLSALLLHLAPFRQWLEGATALDQDIVLAAVLGHHLKAPTTAFAGSYEESFGTMQVLTGHPDFATLLAEAAAVLKIAGTAPVIASSRWAYEPQPGVTDLDAFGRTVHTRLLNLDTELQAAPARRRLLNAVRAALIAADTAGSGLFREGYAIGRWVDDAFDENKLIDGEWVRREIIGPRVADIAGRGRAFKWNEFQLACRHLPDRALLLAPCGSGKTLAAWQWIAAQLDARPAARVIFLYPTRGTASEGFRDYVAWAPGQDAALAHGTAEYELDGLFEDPDDARHGRFTQSHARLFALRHWPKRVFSATVDQFLGFLQHNYGSTCLLPLLADSVVVVDEVHSFDRGLFSALQELLTQFDVPVLCMTATLPQERRQALEACGLTVYPQEAPADLRQGAEYKRYRIRRTTTDAASEVVHEALRHNRRVLWVVNNVKRCQAIARTFSDAVEGTVLCYHSRFKLKHRHRRHKAVVDAFRPAGGPRASGVLAVTTQVCEMSLDLDADVVVTESAPATALIQRMGRGCREVRPQGGRTADVWIYQPENEKPYTPEQLVGVEAFVDQACELGVASQTDLDALLADMPQTAVELKKQCRFIESGPWAVAGEVTLRDGDDFTRPAVLPEDVEKYSRLRRGDKPHRADGLELPVPIHLAKGFDVRLPKWLAVAEGGHYVPAVGYLDESRPAEELVI